MVAKVPRGSRAYVIRELMFDHLDYIAANLSSADAMEPRQHRGTATTGDRLTLSVACRPRSAQRKATGYPYLGSALPVSTKSRAQKGNAPKS